ncbi:MAG TPA: hypothetical protein PK344_05035 [Syntrophorhabdaceae bacterium]|nr:hypothetical protein [Syntrophorhabdaceae bacterium]
MTFEELTPRFPLPCRTRVGQSTLSPLPWCTSVRTPVALGNTIPSPLAEEGQGTGNTAVSLFPLPWLERVIATCVPSPLAGEGQGEGERIREILNKGIEKGIVLL